MAKKIVFGGTNSKELAKKIAKKLKVPYAALIVDHFPDGETYLRLPMDVKGKEVVLVESMHPNPDVIMVETIFAARTAKELGAKKVIIVAPYLAYLRQDKRFHPRECKSNTIMSALMTCGDEIIAVDPHIQRIKKLQDIFKIKAKQLTSNREIAKYIKKNIKNPVILGPDWESFQWAEKIAKMIKVEVTVLRKKRYTARHVKIKLKIKNGLKGRNVVIIDDIISSGHTMIEVIKQAKKMKSKSITCIGVHGVFAENAYKKLKKAGATRIITTNTIQRPTSKIDISGIIADALK